MTEASYRSPIAWGRAICYSGFRRGQGPHLNSYPTVAQIEEDLRLLEKDWDYIRLYDVGTHGERVLQVIRSKELNLKVLLGVCLDAEVSNPNCPWGADYSKQQLNDNISNNSRQIVKLGKLAEIYEDIVIAVSAGNEATVDWTDHLVPVASVVAYVRYLKRHTKKPVTFCENYEPWQEKLTELAEEVDFISLHTYPLWEYKDLRDAMAYTKDNYASVKSRYPHKQVMITEAGWATNSNGRGMLAESASEINQCLYCNELLEWSRKQEIIVFLFEAFDEDWKGSSDSYEPEKHWGIYDIDRQPKLILRDDCHQCLQGLNIT